ncbi:DUF29 domain-containing protein [Endozoicomonas sp. ONNA1]|uniref:DUF29 domain-containing protein n=1 Tax=Endozoicomonas sp. ONNA1 TaxID=2828740 RepID=UPI002147C322|nr:DUF29 domain-containing protein [Endozoicomonas sp. ONNA1]
MNSLYERDFYSWTCQQAKLLKEGKLNELDIENLLEEVETMGRSEYKTLKNCLKQLLLHLLKWQKQSQNKDGMHDINEWYRSWKVTVNTQRFDVEEELEENPGLQPKLDEILVKAYQNARRKAADDLRCHVKDFPTECPWTYKQIMTKDWLP